MRSDRRKNVIERVREGRHGRQGLQARSAIAGRRREIAARRRAMALFARARRDELAAPIAERWPDHGARDLKPVESGLVMLRGRIGGDGAPFNLGEATVTRAVVELPTGERGFAHILGRDAEKARLAAIADALWQRRPSARRDRGGDSRADRGAARRRSGQDARRDRGDAGRLLHPRARRGRGMSALAFADPTFESQAAFRRIMRALSAPGTILTCGRGAAPPAPLAARRRGAALLTLADFETPLWIAPSFPRSGRRLSCLPHRRAARRSSPTRRPSRWSILPPTGSTSRTSRKGRRNIPTARRRSSPRRRVLDAGPRLRLSGPGIRRRRDARRFAVAE